VLFFPKIGTQVWECFFYPCSEPSSCHGVSQQVLACFVIKLTCSMMQLRKTLCMSIVHIFT